MVTVMAAKVAGTGLEVLAHEEHHLQTRSTARKTKTELQSLHPRGAAGAGGGAAEAAADEVVIVRAKMVRRETETGIGAAVADAAAAVAADSAGGQKREQLKGRKAPQTDQLPKPQQRRQMNTSKDRLLSKILVVARHKVRCCRINLARQTPVVTRQRHRQLTLEAAGLLCVTVIFLRVGERCDDAWED